MLLFCRTNFLLRRKQILCRVEAWTIRNIYFTHLLSATVKVKEGKLRGRVRKNTDGKEYYSFKGIPYAQPPVGNLRFKAPLPPKPWSGTLDALEHGAICPQYDVIVLKYRDGDEDCLFLNVYTPTLKTDSKLPVMVYIYEGGFACGSGDEITHGPQFLLRHDVILVTFNYRLEVLGFLCLDTPEVPGNAGMKDQVAALRWVQNNITQFGGDPDNVTIFGASSGAACVTYLMMSPMTKGLFHKAIAQSGTCLADFALDVNPVDRAFRAGKLLGIDTKDIAQLQSYLQGLHVDKLINLNIKTATEDEKFRELTIKFVPVVEKKFGNNEVFLQEKPLDLLLSGKIHPVPFLTGYTSLEGLVLLRDEIPKLEHINKHPSVLVPREIYLKVSGDKLLDFGERIRQFYWGNRELNADDFEIIADIQSDIHFVTPLYRYCDYYSKYCKSIYMYRFDLDTELNWISALLGLPQCNRVAHIDEIFYIFKSDIKKDVYEKHPELHKYVHGMTKLWTNFAKTSNPTPDNSLGVIWLPYTTTSRKYLRIEESLSMGSDAEKKRLDFWTKLYSEAGLPSLVKSQL